MTRTVRALALALSAAAVGAVAASPAAAIPIRNFQVSDNGSVTRFSATLVSPANARSCIANVRAVMGFPGQDGSAPRIIKALGNHRINVCAEGRRGVTTGRVRGQFPTANLKRPYQYNVCIRATQVLRNGNNSSHFVCKPVYLLY
ncbi:MAG TPA: hypothetical protein VNT51_09395 [Miltoncostaeaceae bacterium]|nr:hypothetical protein [Miltoncostaeaceae bacterium]